MWCLGAPCQTGGCQSVLLFHNCTIIFISLISSRPAFVRGANPGNLSPWASSVWLLPLELQSNSEPGLNHITSARPGLVVRNISYFCLGICNSEG